MYFLPAGYRRTISDLASYYVLDKSKLQGSKPDEKYLLLDTNTRYIMFKSRPCEKAIYPPSVFSHDHGFSWKFFQQCLCFSTTTQ